MKNIQTVEVEKILISLEREFTGLKRIGDKFYLLMQRLLKLATIVGQTGGMQEKISDNLLSKIPKNVKFSMNGKKGTHKKLVQNYTTVQLLSEFQNILERSHTELVYKTKKRKNLNIRFYNNNQNQLIWVEQGKPCDFEITFTDVELKKFIVCIAEEYLNEFGYKSNVQQYKLPIDYK
jgi:hypothetical protein